MDGARLGCALAARDADMTLADAARLCDAFYIGGTKNGALCGEAVIFPHGAPAHFFTTVKQLGARLAKGRLLGVQFDALFTDGLYLRLAGHAVAMAERLERGLRRRAMNSTSKRPRTRSSWRWTMRRWRASAPPPPTASGEKRPDGRTVVRLAASWATRPEDVDELIRLM
jgi:threonine aldolase